MYISHIALENFAGIYSGTGKKSISIDFPKPTDMNSRIVLLLGGNGSGKSTLLSSLHPFAESFDARDDLIIKSEKEGAKEIHFSDKKGLRYIIKHFYSRNNKGGIKTKSFITKYEGKKCKELNENGGVTTFKEIIENEFRLNSDFFKIGRLASQTSNFTALQTAARKDFIIQYLPNTDPYLEAYRNSKDKLNKIKDKIDYITKSLEKLGNKEEISKTVNLCQEFFNDISAQLVKDEALFKKEEEKIKELKSSEEYKEANSLIVQKEAAEKELENIKTIYSKKSIDFKFDPDKLFDEKEITEVMSTYGKNTAKRDNNEKEYKAIEKELEELYSEISEVSTRLTKKESDLREYNNVNKSIQELTDMEVKNNTEFNKLILSNSRNEDLDVVKAFNSYEISESTKFSSYSTIKNFFVDISRNLQSYYTSGYDFDDESKKEIERLLNDETVDYDLSKSLAYSKFEKTRKEFEEKQELLRDLNYKYKEAKKHLNDRPKNCNNDNCFFIKQFVENSKLGENVKKLEDEVNNLNNKQIKLEKELEVINYCKEVSSSLKVIERTMNNYKGDSNILMAVFSSIFDEPEDVFDAIKKAGSAEEIIIRIKKIDDIFNYIKEKEDIKRIEKDNENIKMQMESIKNNEKFVNGLKRDINELREKQDKLKEKREELRSKLNEAKSGFEKVKYIVSTLEVYIENRNNKEKILKEIDKINKKIEKSSNIINKIKEAEWNMEVSKKEYDETKQKYDESEKNLLDAKTKLSKYEEFEKEYAEATENSKKTEVVVNSCDPKKGIPLAFMQEFLNSTSEFANELFDMAYQGKFRINFDVNEKEFNIPVLKEDGSVLNDIKEASDGESSLVKTIISLALLSRYNSVFPILCLDEVDGPLDDKYRSSFAEIIDGQIEVLNLEQVFVISHNDNFRNEDIPVILFPRNTFTSGEKNQIIWNYEEKE